MTAVSRRLAAALAAVAVAGALFTATVSPAEAGTPGSAIVTQARAHIGQHRTDLGFPSEEWCADFALKIWRDAGVENLSGLGSSVQSFKDYGTRNNTTSNTPHVGDAAVHKTAAISHVQIVIGVSADGNMIQTIGGNEGSNNLETSWVKFEDWHDWHTQPTVFVSPVGLTNSRLPASLAGDGRASVVSDSADGTLTAWHNAAGFAQMPFDTSAVIGQGVMDPTRVKFADLDGDGRTDLIYVQPAGNPQNDPEGTLRAWHNDGGMNTMPFGNSVIIGQGFMDPTRVKFADLDGDGRADLVYDQPANNPLNDADGTLRAWHNDGGMNTMPFGNSVIIGQGFTDPTHVHLADLDGDGRADLIYDQPANNPQNDPDGTLRAWHNDNGFTTAPFGDSVIIGQGFMDPTRVKFADLDGDGRADLVYDQPANNPQNDADGTLRAWHNDSGMNTMPFGNSIIIGQGFTNPTSTYFA
ncbi:CHAP domain-containing protein [Kitasatospora sp. NPDC057904]|uniref:CHAP domain-containing protein n=1 Tax=Kitasatospora sp. NPDC057904 TaxID=3346275 RepID=UPI0036DA39CE